MSCKKIIFVRLSLNSPLVGSSVWDKPPELDFVDLVEPSMDIDDVKDSLPDLPDGLEDLPGLLEPPDHLLPAVLPRPTVPPPPQGLEQQDAVSVSR